MKKVIISIIIILAIIFSFYLCSDNNILDNGSSEIHNRISEVEEYIEDGTYLAKVSYHNPRTGHSNTIKLNVDVLNNKLVKIYWPNGGWLDESHFTPPVIEDDRATFIDDRGIEYIVEFFK